MDMAKGLLARGSGLFALTTSFALAIAMSACGAVGDGACTGAACDGAGDMSGPSGDLSSEPSADLGVTDPCAPNPCEHGGTCVASGSAFTCTCALEWMGSTCAVAANVIAVGNLHSCAILPNHSLKCWGTNDYGQLGLGDIDNRGDGAGEMGASLPAIDLGTGRSAISVTVGFQHTCALLDDATVKCWGRNNIAGQLGLGDTDARGDGAGEMGDNLPAVSLGTGRSVKALAGGSYHTCALLDDDSMKCWGNNQNGYLGLGDTNARGDGAGEMGDALPAIDLGTGRKAKAITASQGNTCALLDNGALKCWGYNQYGQLGLGDVNSRGDEAGEMGDNLPAIFLGTGRSAKSLSTGSNHICAVLDNDAVKCWGYNMSGELGLGDVDNRGDGVGEMGDNLSVIALGTGRSAKSIAAGGDFACALLDDASVKCWGDNDTGELGLGDINARGDGAGEMGDSLPTVALGVGRTAKAIAAGASHVCARLDSGDVKCWGRNNAGKLGLGDIVDRGDDANEMGDSLPAVNLE